MVMKCITSNLLIKFSNGNGILLPKIIKLWQCNALLNNVICLKTATGYSKLQKPLKFLQSRMIDGPDVEFLLREKDYRERSPGRFLSIPAFFNGHVPV